MIDRALDWQDVIGGHQAVAAPTRSGGLPQWANDILAASPRRGEGLNRWLLKASIALRRCGRSAEDIQAVLEAATADQPVRHGEIERAVERAPSYMMNTTTAMPRNTQPTLDANLRRKTIGQGVGAVDLWEASPYRLIDDGPGTEQIVDALFPRDAMLCCARTLATAYTAPREAWRDLADMQFIVPSCMTAIRGLTQSGQSSARCLDNTGPRRFLVIEQDQGSMDEQAAVLLHLAQHAPMALVVYSGGKSLHGWFSCRGATEADQQRLFDYAVKLGADPATWPRCQMVRMPEGRRGDGARQPVLFLNPEVLP